MFAPIQRQIPNHESKTISRSLDPCLTLTASNHLCSSSCRSPAPWPSSRISVLGYAGECRQFPAPYWAPTLSVWF